MMVIFSWGVWSREEERHDDQRVHARKRPRPRPRRVGALLRGVVRDGGDALAGLPLPRPLAQGGWAATAPPSERGVRAPGLPLRARRGRFRGGVLEGETAGRS